jgi:hypothetical protein
MMMMLEAIERDTRQRRRYEERRRKKRERIAAVIALASMLNLSGGGAALAQSSPNLSYGAVPTAAQWNSYFAAKQDYGGAPPLLVTGGTMQGKLVTEPSSSLNAGLNIAVGTAPSSPVNGDMWTTSSGLFAFINGVTIGPIGTSTSILTLALGGTNANLTASNGGVVYSNASALAILSGTVTAGQCLLSGSSTAPTWGTCTGTGVAAVSSVTNGDGSLTFSPTTGPVVGSLATSHANTWSGIQTFGFGDFKLAGSSSGTLTVSALASAAAGIISIPNGPDTVALLGTSETFSGSNTFSASNTFSSTLNVSGTFQYGGNTMYFPGFSSAVSVILAPQGRLTLQSGSAVMLGNAAATSVIYYDCFKGGKVVWVYNGTSDVPLTVGSCEISNTLQTSSTGVNNNNDLFDDWAINDSGTLRLCVATNGSGGGWSSDSGSLHGRGTGYSQIDNTTRSFLTNKNQLTHCYFGSTDKGPINANNATLLGTHYTVAAGKTRIDFSATGSGGGSNVAGLANVYNVQPLNIFSSDSTASNAGYTLNAVSAWQLMDTGQPNKNTISFVDPIATVSSSAQVNNSCGANNSSSWDYFLGVGFNWSSGQPANVNIVTAFGPGTGTTQHLSGNNAQGSFPPAIGFNVISAVESTEGAVACGDFLFTVAYGLTANVQY